MVSLLLVYLGGSEDRNDNCCYGKTVRYILHSHRLEKCPSHSGELFPALSKYCQIFRNFVKCCQKLQYIAKYSLMLVNIDKYCQMLPNITKCFKIMTNIAQWCKGSQLMSDVVKCCPILPNVAKWRRWYRPAVVSLDGLLSVSHHPPLGALDGRGRVGCHHLFKIHFFQGDGWLRWKRYGSSLGSNPEISQKYQMGDISKRVANTL